jgi:hypothetical protein
LGGFLPRLDQCSCGFQRLGKKWVLKIGGKMAKKYPNSTKTNESDFKPSTCRLHVLGAVMGLERLSVALSSSEGHLWVSARPLVGEKCFSRELTGC